MKELRTPNSKKRKPKRKIDQVFPDPGDGMIARKVFTICFYQECTTGQGKFEVVADYCDKRKLLFLTFSRISGNFPDFRYFFDNWGFFWRFGIIFRKSCNNTFWLLHGVAKSGSITQGLVERSADLPSLAKERRKTKRKTKNCEFCDRRISFCRTSPRFKIKP